MISRNHIDISTLVEEQLPGFVLDTSVSMLPRFLEYYYEFMESEEEQNNFTRDILKYFDSFSTKEDVLNWNYEEVALLPHKMATDKRKFAKRVYDLYRTKGTEESVKLLFRAFYDSDADITYPSKNILRSSDGRWSRESEVLVKLSYGAIDTFSEVRVVLSLTNGLVVYKTATRAIKVDGKDEYWLTFDAAQKVSLDVGNRIVGYDDSGAVSFFGEVAPTPIKIEVVRSGTGFRVGQIFRITGTQRDSVFKITAITPSGGIRSGELIQFGYGHPENLMVDVSPFKNFLLSSSYTYTPTEISPTETHHHISINDAIYQISDRVDGGEFVTDSRVNEQTSGLPTGSIGLTIDQYQESVSTIKIISGGTSHYPGKWTTNDGRLNTPDIVLQDNYYYQAFSYVIHSGVNLTDYENSILPISHPAGMKNFADMVKTISFDVSPSFDIYRIRKHVIHLDDNIAPIDGMRKIVNKFFDEGSVAGRYVVYGYWDEDYSEDTSPLKVVDEISKHPFKTFSGDVSISDNNTTNITKVLNEVISLSEMTSKNVERILVDGSIITDSRLGYLPPYAIVGYWSPDYVTSQIDVG